MKIFKKIALNCLLLSILVLPLLSFAATSDVVPPCTAGTTCIGNPFKGGNDLNALIVTILNKVVMPIAAVASVLYIIWAGFQYVMARGNSTKITEANQNLLYALIGIGVLLGAAGISKVVQDTVTSLTN